MQVGMCTVHVLYVYLCVCVCPPPPPHTHTRMPTHVHACIPVHVHNIVSALLATCTLLVIYRGLLPHAILLLRRMPVIGHILNAPGIRTVRHA